jgi:hypothetical protein
MADSVRKVSYCYPIVPNRAGQGANVLGEIRNGGVNLLAHLGFPIGSGRAQLDLVTNDMARLRSVARHSSSREAIGSAQCTSTSDAWPPPT